MYVPTPYDREVPIRPLHSENAKIIYSGDYRYFERWNYHGKRSRIVRSLASQVDLTSVSLMHAHHLFTAGGVAYELKRMYNIPYVVAVRNTDINWFFRYALHLRKLGVRMLCEAARIVFISPSGLQGLRRYIPARLWPVVANKSLVIPNGVDGFWLNNIFHRTGRSKKDPIKLLYVGQITRNKNVQAVISVATELEKRGLPTEVCIVGDGPYAHRIRRIAARDYKTAKILGRIDCTEKLMELYRASDIFIMPSWTETFGLVYIEAMSQGLPIIYTCGQGIDGFFDDGYVGYACDPRNSKQMADRVTRIVRDFDQMSKRCTEIVDRFSWSVIATQYDNLYIDVGRTPPSTE